MNRKIAVIVGGLVVLVVGAALMIAHWHTSKPKSLEVKAPANVQTVKTDCYQLVMPKMYQVTTDVNNNGVCSFSASSQGLPTYQMVGLRADVTQDNLQTQVRGLQDKYLQSLSSEINKTVTFDSEHAGTFQGDPAYFILAHAETGALVESVFILHDSHEVANLFTLDVFTGIGAKNIDLSPIEQGLVWN